MAKSKKRKKIGNREFLVKRINKMEKNSLDAAINVSLLIPCIIIEEHYNKLIKKEVDGKTRSERMLDLCLEMFQDLQDGKITITDLEKKFHESTGATVEEVVKIQAGRNTNGILQ